MRKQEREAGLTRAGGGVTFCMANSLAKAVRVSIDLRLALDGDRCYKNGAAVFAKLLHCHYEHLVKKMKYMVFAHRNQM